MVTRADTTMLPGVPQRGVTLVELLVVATLSSIIVILALQTWRPQQNSMEKLRDRAHVVSELRLAVDWLRQDLSGAETVEKTIDDELHIEREEAVAVLAGAWTGSEDPGITYSLQGDDLVRYDVAEDVSMIVATRYTAFDITESGNEIHVDVTAGSGLGDRSVELIWTN